MNKNKLKERCNILRKCIIALSEIYHDGNANEDQRKFMETMLGAAIFYLSPLDKDLWTGKGSEEALKWLKQGRPINKLTKEHEFPRKLAGQEVLTSELDSLKNSECRLFELYTSKYGKWNYVLKKENIILREFQKDGIFVSTSDSYLRAGIKLVEIDESFLQTSKRKGIDDAEWV